MARDTAKAMTMMTCNHRSALARALLLVAFMATGCLSDHCEVYPEHCAVADDGSSEDEETTDADGLCGDEIVQAGEECDQGAANGPGHPCTSECMLNICGDGELGPGEGCDDGNDVDDDGCTNACVPISCGDGKIDEGEACDDGNADDTDACLGTCAMASCGDEFVFAGQEECDQGASNSDMGMCTANCVNAVCGDGLVWQGNEACDEGDDNTNDFDGCTTQCTVPEPPVLQLTNSPIKQFEFSWAPVIGAEYYQLLESADVGEMFVQVGGDIVGESTALTVPLHFRVNAS